jgi:hypothetical protein
MAQRPVSGRPDQPGVASLSGRDRVYEDEFINKFNELCEEIIATHLASGEPSALAGKNSSALPRAGLMVTMSDFPATDLNSKATWFGIQSNLVWDSIKPISNFCFQFFLFQ